MNPFDSFAKYEAHRRVPPSTPIRRSAHKRTRLGSPDDGPGEASTSKSHPASHASSRHQALHDEVVPSTPSRDRTDKASLTKKKSESNPTILTSIEKAFQKTREGRPGIPGGGSRIPKPHHTPTPYPALHSPRDGRASIGTTSATDAASSPSLFETAILLAGARPKRHDTLGPSSSFGIDARPAQSSSRSQINTPDLRGTHGKLASNESTERGGFLNSSPQKTGRRGGHIKNGLAERAASAIKKARTETRLWAYDLSRTAKEQINATGKAIELPCMDAPLAVQVLKTWTGHKIIIAHCRIENTQKDEENIPRPLTPRPSPVRTQIHSQDTEETLDTPTNSAAEERAILSGEGDKSAVSQTPKRSGPPKPPESESQRQAASLQQALDAALRYEHQVKSRQTRSSTTTQSALQASPQAKTLNAPSESFDGIIIFSFALQPKPPVCSEAELSACYGEIYVDIWQPWQEIICNDEVVLLVHLFALRK